MKLTNRVKSVDEYIKSFPKNVGSRLKIVRGLIKKLAPKAEEKIGYNIPMYKLGGVLIYFAGHTNHIGIYPYPSTLKAFKQESAKYKTSTGSIQFPYDKPLPVPLIAKIVKYRVKEKLKNKK